LANQTWIFENASAFLLTGGFNINDKARLIGPRELRSNIKTDLGELMPALHELPTRSWCFGPI
jgi:hypothetical protein